jgi:hypothetical protein
MKVALMQTIMVYENFPGVVGTLVPDEEYAAMSADQFREALANTDSLVVVRRPDGRLCVEDSDYCKDIELSEEALSALASTDDDDAFEAIVKAAEEDMRQRGVGYY